MNQQDYIKALESVAQFVKTSDSDVVMLITSLFFGWLLCGLYNVKKDGSQ